MQAVTQDRLELFAEMEAKYEKKDTAYFVNLLTHPDYVVRTRATCILVDFGGEDKVPRVAKVLKNDVNELVRHEAAFSLGQMCLSICVPPLADATLHDPSMWCSNIPISPQGFNGRGTAEIPGRSEKNAGFTPFTKETLCCNTA